MTYISEDLDRICRKYCDDCGTCPCEHECSMRKLIKETIVRMMGVNNDS